MGSTLAVAVIDSVAPVSVVPVSVVPVATTIGVLVTTDPVTYLFTRELPTLGGVVLSSQDASTSIEVIMITDNSIFFIEYIVIVRIFPRSIDRSWWKSSSSYVRYIPIIFAYFFFTFEESDYQISPLYIIIRGILIAIIIRILACFVSIPIEDHTVIKIREIKRNKH